MGDVFQADREAAALLPCPFCGGEAQRFTIEEEGENFGGDVIACTGKCGASSHVEFGRKENLVSLWNTRTAAERATSPAGDAGDAVAWVSPHQFAAHKDDSSGEAGNYLPVRKSRAGNFTMPLYLRPQAGDADVVGEPGA